MDCGQRGMAAGNRWHKIDPVRRWIAAWYESWPDMNGWPWWMTAGWWQEMDHGRWIPINLLPYMAILRLHESIPFSRSLWSQATKFQLSADMQAYHSAGTWLHGVRYRALFRAPFRALFRDTDLCIYIPQLQCGYRTSRSRIRSVVSRAMIFKVGDNSARIAIILTTNWEKCTQGSNGKHTYRWIKKPPEILHCYWKSISESSLPNQYGTQRSRNGLVVGGATTYKQGMTVLEVLGGSTLERTYQQRIAAGD